MPGRPKLYKRLRAGYLQTSSGVFIAWFALVVAAGVLPLIHAAWLRDATFVFCGKRPGQSGKPLLFRKTSGFIRLQARRATTTVVAQIGCGQAGCDFSEKMWGFVGLRAIALDHKCCFREDAARDSGKPHFSEKHGVL